MECKYTKQNVNVGNTVLTQSAEHQVDTEIVLPDYCGDIKRMLKCKVTPCVTSKAVNSDSLSVDADACISVYYVDDSGSIRCYECREPFSHSFELPARVDSATADIGIKVGTVNCRAITERKIALNCSVHISAKVKSCVPTEIVTDIDEPTVLMQRGSEPSSTMVGFDEKYLLVSDEMSVGDRDESIKTILRTDSRVLVEDKKIIGNKIIIKGDLLVKFLYIGEESGACCTASEQFPFSQILDVMGLNDTCTCTVDARVISCDIRPQSDMSGMLRKAMVSAKLHLTTAAYCNAEVPYITDAYSTENCLDLKYDTIGFENITFSLNEPHLITRNLDIPTENIERVLDVWNDASLINTGIKERTLTVKGCLIVYVLALDTSNEAMFFERNVDFDYTCELDNEPKNWECNCSLTPVNLLYSLTRGDIEIKSEVNIRLDLVERTDRKVVVDSVLGDKLTRKYSNSSVVIYRASSGERLWDIAKRYSTSVDSICKLNSLDCSKPVEEGTIVIPVGSI